MLHEPPRTGCLGSSRVCADGSSAGAAGGWTAGATGVPVPGAAGRTAAGPGPAEEEKKELRCGFLCDMSSSRERRDRDDRGSAIPIS